MLSALSAMFMRAPGSHLMSSGFLAVCSILQSACMSSTKTSSSVKLQASRAPYNNTALPLQLGYRKTCLEL